MGPRLIVLGWDSATFDVVDPLVAEGRLPALSALMGDGFRAPLRSTWPPMTDCAWTSAFTGHNAGRHGLFGSWYRAPGAYACTYFSARDRLTPAVWDAEGDARWLVWNVPMTFPPAPIEGVMVAGYGAPPGARFCSPAGFQEALADRRPLDDLVDRAPHGSLESFLDDLLRGLEAQAEALPWAIRESGADCALAVWPHVDRAQHFFWRFRGTDHRLANAVDLVYEAMDEATGIVRDRFPDADVLVVSDHGAGALEGDVNLGSWFVETGRAVYGTRKPSPLLRTAWALPPKVRRRARRMAPGAARRAMGATLTGQLGAFDWGATRAFAGFHSDVWVNLEGREPAGTVSEAEADGFVDELRTELLSIEDPRSGKRVFAGAHRRAELFSGPAAHLAPDLMLDSWGAGYRVAPGREASDTVIAPAPLAGVGEAWSADHRPVGIWVGAGPHIARGRGRELSLLDVAPTVLALLERPVPEGLDGEVAIPAIDAGWLERHPVRWNTSSTQARAGGDRTGELSGEEAAAVAAHLKNLGYIE